jgi:hypothetical protein
MHSFAIGRASGGGGADGAFPWVEAASAAAQEVETWLCPASDSGGAAAGPNAALQWQAGAASPAPWLQHTVWAAADASPPQPRPRLPPRRCPSSPAGARPASAAAMRSSGGAESLGSPAALCWVGSPGAPAATASSPGRLGERVELTSACPVRITVVPVGGA